MSQIMLFPFIITTIVFNFLFFVSYIIVLTNQSQNLVLKKPNNFDS